MNARLAKKIRSAAEHLTIGKPYCCYERSGGYGSPIHLGDCTRKKYREMKKHINRIRREK